MWQDPLYDYIFIGVDGFVVGILYGLYRSGSKLISNILEAPSVAVGPDLEQLLDEHGNNLDYAVITGKVHSLGTPVQSQSGLKGVLQVVSMNEHSVRRQAFGHWDDNVQTLRQTLNSVPFALKNLSHGGNRIHVEVKNPLDAEHADLLMPVSTNFSPSPVSVGTAIVSFLSGHSSKGIETTEKFLPVGTVVTGIGQVTRDASGDILLNEPKATGNYLYCLTRLPVQTIVKRLEKSNSYLKVTAYVLATAGIIIALRRLRIVWKKWKQEKMRETALRNRENINIEGLSSAEICITCLNNPRETLIMDCGHVAVCSDCSLRLNDKCPVCNQPIRGTHIAFIA